MNKAPLLNTLRKAAPVLLGCLFVWGCENDQAELDALTGKRTLVEEGTNVQSLFSQNGRLKAILKAPLMRRFQTDTVQVEFPRSLKVDFYDSTGRVESQLSALYGKYFESLGRVLLRDSVVVYNIKGDTLRTSELWWDQNTQRFYTDKAVRFRSVDRNIYGGRGLEAHQDLSNWSIFEPTGVFLMQQD